MGKKIAIVLLLAVLAIAAWLYFQRARPAPLISGSNPQRYSVPLPQPSKLTTDSSPAAGGVPEKPTLPPSPPAFAPRPGESLEFAANVPKLNSTIANLTLVVLPKQNFAGESAWRFQAFAHTENPYRMVFALDDEFDSYSDAANNLTSLQYEMHLNERGQKVDSVQRMLSSPRDPAPPNATAARVLPGTRDPLGMLQYLRGIDWSKTPEVRSPVFDGRKLYDVRASLAAKSVPVSVPAGTFNAEKIELHVFENGAEMKDAHFLLYLTNDSARTPVLLEAVLPITNARVELTRAR